MVFAEADIARAFGDDEFFPVFQPLAELRTGQLAGFEILARWRHDRHGLITPDDFIPALEQTGSIAKLTPMILKKAFASQTIAESALTTSVNISASQLRGSGVPERLAEVAGEAGFALEDGWKEF